MEPCCAEVESFRKTFAEQAERQVKIRLALEKIVELENIQPTEEEIEAEYAKMSELYKLEVEQIKNFVREEDLKKDLASGKAIDLVRENAEITEEAPAEEAPAPKKKATRKKKADEAEEPKAE